VKAVLILRQTDFPKTHDIVDLLLLLQDSGQEITEEILEAGRLSRYAVETRYPGPAEPISENEYRQALALAEKVVQWAGQVIAGGK
jgi:HEPN domain-containing protein